MASVLKVDKLDPQSGTALELGTSGDTISVPSGATLDISASTLTPPATMPASSAANLTNIPGANVTGTIAAVSGANLTSLNATNLGSGTVPDARFPATIPAASGVNLTSLNATNLGSGTVPTARLGTGTASGSTFLAGDNTWGAAGGGKILQVVHRSTNSTAYTTSDTLGATDLYATITPTADTSTILVLMHFRFGAARGGASPNTTGVTTGYAIFRDINGGGYVIRCPDNDGITYNLWGYTRDYATLPTIYFKYDPTLMFVDSPATTDACTYKLYYRANSSTAYFGGNHNSDHTTLLEIDGS